MALRTLVILLVATVALALGDDARITVGGETNTVAHYNRVFPSLLEDYTSAKKIDSLIQHPNFVLSTENILALADSFWHSNIVPCQHLTHARLSERLQDNRTLGEHLLFNYVNHDNEVGVKHIILHYTASPEAIGEAIDIVLNKDQRYGRAQKILRHLEKLPNVLPDGGVYDPKESSAAMCHENDHRGMRAYINKYPDLVFELVSFHDENDCGRRTLAVIKGAAKRLSCSV